LKIVWENALTIFRDFAIGPFLIGLALSNILTPNLAHRTWTRTTHNRVD
jgi:hypothetical protein